VSGFRFWVVACDGLEAGGRECDFGESDVPCWTLTEARQHAAEAGWRVAIPAGAGWRRDLCPRHRDDDRDPRHYAGQKPTVDVGGAG
jgi:hypothetical protein